LRKAKEFMKVPALYITAIYNLKISGDLGKGINIRGGIYLTNNKNFVSSLLTDSLLQAIGNLEFQALLDAEAVFYKMSDDSISTQNEDDLLCDFLANCGIIINEFWLIKDHAIDLMLGFVEYPYLNSQNLELPYHLPTIHSNWITGGSHNSSGTNDQVTFSRHDIEQVIAWGSSFLIEPFSRSQSLKTAIRPGMQRITRAIAFLSTARKQKDLGIRITHYCSAFECLFSTSTTELTHKLAERVAYFLEAESKNRLIVYDDLKNIYTIRSQVTHGSAISSKLFPKVNDYSMKADNFLRRVFVKLQTEERLDKYYRKENAEDLEKYLTELTLGYDRFAIMEKEQ
jgi:hypothetical protein